MLVRFRIFLLALSTALLAVQSASAKIVGDTFSESGFSITKPKDWDFIKNLKNPGLALKDGKTSSGESGILVAFSKKMGAGFKGVNPAIGVKEIKVPAKSTLVEWLTEEMKRQAANDNYYIQVSPALAMSIGGKSGAQASYANSVIMDGEEIMVYHVLYVAKFGAKVFLINMNCNEGLSHDYVATFGKVADTIQPATNLPQN